MRDRELWIEYLVGAHEVYRRHGVAAALDLDAVFDGADTSMFFVVVDAHGQVRGGSRVQGPHRRVSDTHALREWDDNPGRGGLIAAVDKRLAHGVIEVKTAWVDPDFAHAPTVAALLARTALPMLDMFGARHIMATAADHALRRWVSSGGRVDETVPSSAYPDERYRTQLMWWDRRTIHLDADPEVLALMRADSAILCEAVWQARPA